MFHGFAESRGGKGKMRGNKADHMTPEDYAELTAMVSGAKA